MKLKLYHYWRSSSSWRVRWALALKQVPCEFIPINLLADEESTPAHLARNPMGYVPVLEITESEGAPLQFLGESVAIIEWLEELFPTPSLFHGNSFLKARSRQLAELINAGTQPLQNLNVSLHHSNDAEEQKQWNQYWIRHGLKAYETLVAETCGRFSVGDQLTLADLFLIPQCYNALRNEVPLQEFPLIEKINERALATESCKAAAPERFKP